VTDDMVRDEHEHEALSVEAEHAHEAVAALDDPAAGAEFRARLLRDFSTGSIAGRAPTLAARAIDAAERQRGGAPAAPPSEQATPATPPAIVRVPVAPRPAWREGARRWGLVPALAAAAVLVVALLNRGPAWRMTGASGEGIAVVDGRPIPMNHVDELRAALVPGARVRVPPGCDIEIESRGTMAIHMVSETDATVPAPPGRWFGRRIAAEVNSGEWQITTGSRFHGAELAIVTPEAHVEVRGTTLAVIREAHGTCVCVFDGKVRVGRDAADMVMVQHGHRRFVFNDGREPEMDDILPREQAGLSSFRDAKRGEMQ
jgi:ferric-dicitrate binding protein FerR (iron transport regulator)